MEEEKKCSRKIKKLVACPRGTGENIKCFVEKKIPVRCRKQRCIDGRLKYDDPKTNRKAGEPCLDAK